jgi:hypothetical protein
VNRIRHFSFSPLNLAQNTLLIVAQIFLLLVIQCSLFFVCVRVDRDLIVLHFFRINKNITINNAKASRSRPKNFKRNLPIDGK